MACQATAVLKVTVCVYGSRYLVVGVPGTWFSVLGSTFLVLGTGYLVLAWY